MKHGDKGDKGADGHAPEINVKRDADGKLYWTIDGQWMLDESQNKISAEGKDGAPGAPGAEGITPQLRVNANNIWEVSKDNGTTWEELKDGSGNPVKATGDKGEQGDQGVPGKDADAYLTIIEEGENITIIYKGTTYNVHAVNLTAHGFRYAPTSVGYLWFNYTQPNIVKVETAGIPTITAATYIGGYVYGFDDSLDFYRMGHKTFGKVRLGSSDKGGYAPWHSTTPPTRFLPSRQTDGCLR